MWKYIQIDGNSIEDINNEGHHFIEMIIEGFNDPDKTWIPADELVVVRGTLKEDDVTFKVTYKKDYLENNETIKKYVEETKTEIKSGLTLLNKALKSYALQNNEKIKPADEIEGEVTSFTLTSGDLEIQVTGKSEMPFWNHDLKIDAALSLLSTVDYKDFAESNQYDLFNKKMKELQELIDCINE
ncbi:hypothetical protein [Bacillus sp. Brlt_9]|uniref:hypothetical protein n=1 Tax=Bacillus sp. Brlt_9 TaxID=3110916 RepID=UPI003F7C4873